MSKVMGFTAVLALALVFTTGVYAEESDHSHRDKNSWTGSFETKDGRCYFKTGDNEVVTAAGEKATDDAKIKLNGYADQLVGKGSFIVTGDLRETDGKKWIAVATIKKAHGDGDHGDRK